MRRPVKVILLCSLATVIVAIGSGAAWEQIERNQTTHRKLDDSSHVIQLERPDAVVDAIRAVVSQVRAVAALGSVHAQPRLANR